MGGGAEGGEQTAGVKPMSITGRVERERERLHGMTAEERAWRKKWLADQVLSPNEPKYIKLLEKEYYNPIRRAYRFPLDFIFHRVLEPYIGFDAAKVFRFYTGRGLLGLAGIYGIWYYMKYCSNDWTRKGGWRVIRSKKAIYPGEPGYGQPIVDKAPNEYNDRGFNQSIYAKPSGR